MVLDSAEPDERFMKPHNYLWFFLYDCPVFRVHTSMLISYKDTEILIGSPPNGISRLIFI